MIPTAGRIVEYTLIASDAEEVNRRRSHAAQGDGPRCWRPFARVE